MQHVVITGGSSGIGEAFGRRHAARGNRISLIARDQVRLQAARDRLMALGDGTAQIAIFPADVSDADACLSAIDLAQERAGPCDVLITSAGAVSPGHFDALALSDFEHLMAVNYFGTIHAVRAVYPQMKRRGRGNILMIGSAAGLIGVYGYTAYAPSKYALTGFAEALRAEARPFGINVSICYPPDTDTPQLAAENLRKPAQTRAITRKAGLWSADAVAECADRAMQRGRFAIYPGAQTKALGWFGSLIKPLLFAWFDRTLRRMR